MITINNKIKKIAIGIIACILIIILLKDWLIPKIIVGLGGYTESKTKVTKDTLSIKYKDLYIKYKELQTKVTDIPEPEYIDNYSYVKKTNTKDTSTTGKIQPKITVSERVKRYNTAINDSILTGNIETILSLEDCKIISQSLNYQPKIPYIREKIITVVETKETVLSQKERAYIGGGIEANLNNQITPQILYLTKKKWLYKVGYQKDITNTLPNTVQVGIAKLF